MTPPSPPNIHPQWNAPSPSYNTTAAQTGRPAIWTKSHQRKLARLYVYTTLPLQKILAVVHHSPGGGGRLPGNDSANKNLNALLDTEPRWLHPKSSEDMGRRVEQLALSPVRTASSRSTLTRSSSDPPPPNFTPVQYNAPTSTSPTSLAVPPHFMGPWSAPASAAGSAPGTPSSPTPGPVFRSMPGPGSGSMPGAVDWFAQQPVAPQNLPPQPLPSQKLPPGQKPLPAPSEDYDNKLFAPFLRRATIMSTSTDASTATLKEVLAGYSTAYRGVVKGLMRRFTGIEPLPRNVNMSPLSEAHSAVMDWLDDEHAPAPYSGRPYPLPGDFLNIDGHNQTPHTAHEYQRCLCNAADEFRRASAVCSPWVTPDGLTDSAYRIINNEVYPHDLADIDAFGNTLLHFVAARCQPALLLGLICHSKASDLVHKFNTAGQTLLHVMSPQTMMQPDQVKAILDALAQMGMDIYTQDHYGRNFFHMLRANGLDQATLNQILEPYNTDCYNRRDAFDEKPKPSAAVMTSSLSTESAQYLSVPLGEDENGVIIAQSHILKGVNRAQQEPTYEDPQGRNGLHCLAAAKFSMARTSASTDTELPVPSPAPSGKAPAHRRSSTAKQDSDSSKDRLKLRQTTMENLLDCGVLPGAYDMRGNTPLMAFVAQLPEDGDYKVGPDMLAKFIKRCGGKTLIDARNGSGETALHIAVRCGRKLAVRTLVEAGANVHARDATGRSILEVADAKILAAREDCPKEYAKLEACRAWLSSQRAGAVQSPTIMDEWGRRD